MLSRVAETIYWMQRYRERAENIARLVEVNLYLSIDAPGNAQQQWQPMVSASGDDALFESLYGAATERNVIDFLTFDENNPNSIMNCLLRARENARTIREIIPSEIWHELNMVYLFMRKTAARREKIKSLFEFYAHIRRACQLVTGMTDTTMTHNEAWHFGRIGNLLERADQTSRILDVKYFILLPSEKHVGTPYDDILWAALLKSISGLEMYRKLYPGIHPAQIIDFMILNREFPRSVHSCLYRALASLRLLSADCPAHFSQEPVTGLEALGKELSSIRGSEIIKQGFHEYLDVLQSKISAVCDSIYATYFSPLVAGTDVSKSKVLGQEEALQE